MDKSITLEYKDDLPVPEGDPVVMTMWTSVKIRTPSLKSSYSREILEVPEICTTGSGTGMTLTSVSSFSRCIVRPDLQKTMRMTFTSLLEKAMVSIFRPN